MAWQDQASGPAAHRDAESSIWNQSADQGSHVTHQKERQNTEREREREKSERERERKEDGERRERRS